MTDSKLVRCLLRELDAWRTVAERLEYLDTACLRRNGRRSRDIHNKIACMLDLARASARAVSNDLRDMGVKPPAASGQPATNCLKGTVLP